MLWLPSILWSALAILNVATGQDPNHAFLMATVFLVGAIIRSDIKNIRT